MRAGPYAVKISSEGFRICVSLIRDDQINELGDRLAQLNASIVKGW